MWASGSQVPELVAVAHVTLLHQAREIGRGRRFATAMRMRPQRGCFDAGHLRAGLPVFGPYRTVEGSTPVRSGSRRRCASDGDDYGRSPGIRAGATERALGAPDGQFSRFWSGRLPGAARRGNSRCRVIFGATADVIPSSDGGLLGGRVCWEHCLSCPQAVAGRLLGVFLAGRSGTCWRRGTASSWLLGVASGAVDGATAVVCLRRESPLEPLTGPLAFAMHNFPAGGLRPARGPRGAEIRPILLSAWSPRSPGGVPSAARFGVWTTLSWHAPLRWQSRRARCPTRGLGATAQPTLRGFVFLPRRAGLSCYGMSPLPARAGGHLLSGAVGGYASAVASAFLTFVSRRSVRAGEAMLN